MYFLSVSPVSVSTARHAHLRFPPWRNVNVATINNTQYTRKRTRITNINPCSAEIASVAQKYPPPPPLFFLSRVYRENGGLTYWQRRPAIFSTAKENT